MQQSTISLILWERNVDDELNVDSSSDKHIQHVFSLSSLPISIIVEFYFFRFSVNDTKNEFYLSEYSVQSVVLGFIYDF